MRALSLFIFLFLYIPNTNAATITGGNAATQGAANTIVDMVFAIDTSGSMAGEAGAISLAINTAITTLSCPSTDVWVNARLTGIRGTWGGTLFDETSESVLAGVGAATTINNLEDNGPVVFDFATANTTYYSTIPAAGQSYVKSIVTIGDEGLQNGSPVSQSDYDSGKQANDIAIANNVLVFSLLGNNPSTGAAAIFQALAEGGATLGGHTFNDTGGTFTATGSATPFIQVLQNVICAAASTAPTPTPPPTAQNIPVFGPFGLLASLLGLFWFGNKKRHC